MLRAVHTLWCLAGIADAARHLFHERANTSALDAFSDWPDCEECGPMLGQLLQGIQDAGYLKSASWTDEHVLQAEITEDSLYGNIASRSRVPLMWKVGKSLTFSLAKEGGKTVVSVEGLSLWGPSQGLEIYAEMLEAAQIDGTSCTGSLEDFACIEAEIDAAGAYLQKKWGTMKKDKRKVVQVLDTMYSGATFYALKAAGEWPTIFYSLISTVPRKITAFEFEDGNVAAIAYPDDAHPAHSAFESYNLFDKSSVMGARSLLKCPKPLFQTAVQQAASGMNLAMMLSYGDATAKGAMLTKGIPAGDPMKIGNLMAWCSGSAPGTDPKCHGKKMPGRVAWGPAPPESMQ